MEKERQDIERIHNMTEEEREREFKSKAKVVTNLAPKGKYKFLQKYYHKGGFLLGERKEQQQLIVCARAVLTCGSSISLVPSVLE